MYRKFAERLDELGITTYQVSKNTGISTSTFSAWKHGIYHPKIDKLQRIANFLGMDVMEMIAESDVDKETINDGH